MSLRVSKMILRGGMMLRSDRDLLVSTADIKAPSIVFRAHVRLRTISNSQLIV